MNSGLNVNVSLSCLSIPPNSYLEEPLYAVLDIAPEAMPDPSASKALLNIVILVDSSATMHHFQLTDDEREYWMGVAISRDEMERGEADEREAVYWAGQTLAEMQSVARTPMALVVEGIGNLLDTLYAGDKIAVVAFADRVHTVFSADDWASFPDQCRVQLELLREQRLPVNIGTGTHMADGLRTSGAALREQIGSGGINRLIIISDGIVQDAEASLAAVSEIQDGGYSLTTIGVGDEFDEEFLTQVADNSRGEYRYAPDIAEINDCLRQEVTMLQSTTITDLYVALRGLGGAVVQDLSLVRPAMNLFDEVYTEESWTRARIGSVSTVSPVSVLVQIAPASLPPGDQPLGEALFTWSTAGQAGGALSGNEKAALTVHVAPGAAQINPQVADIVDRYTIYKYEREAQRAQERGDMDKAREKLGAATRELHKIGEGALAAEMEQQIASLGSTGTDPTRLKRIKATTRRLVSQQDVMTTSQDTLQ